MFILSHFTVSISAASRGAWVSPLSGTTGHLPARTKRLLRDVHVTAQAEASQTQARLHCKRSKIEQHGGSFDGQVKVSSLTIPEAQSIEPSNDEDNANDPRRTVHHAGSRHCSGELQSCGPADNARAATALQAIAEMFDIRDGGAPSLQQPCMLVTGLQGVAKALGGYAG